MKRRILQAIWNLMNTVPHLFLIVVLLGAYREIKQQQQQQKSRNPGGVLKERKCPCVSSGLVRQVTFSRLTVKSKLKLPGPVNSYPLSQNDSKDGQLGDASYKAADLHIYFRNHHHPNKSGPQSLKVQHLQLSLLEALPEIHIFPPLLPPGLCSNVTTFSSFSRIPT